MELSQIALFGCTREKRTRRIQFSQEMVLLYFDFHSLCEGNRELPSISLPNFLFRWGIN